MSRENLVEALVQSAKNLGWTEVVSEDTGSTVQLLVSAPGAAEQMVEGAPHRLPKLLKDLGGPENYPALEEYDVPKASAEPGVHQPAEMSPKEAWQAAKVQDQDRGGVPQTAVQLGRVIFIVRADGVEKCRSVFQDRALKIARNLQAKGQDVHLFKAPLAGHVSTALPRPVGERH